MSPEKFEPSPVEDPAKKRPDPRDKINQPAGAETNDEIDRSDVAGDEQKPSLEKAKVALNAIRELVDKFKSGGDRADKMANDPKFNEKVYTKIASIVVEEMAKGGDPLSDVEKRAVDNIIQAVIEGKYDLTTGDFVKPKAVDATGSAQKPDVEAKPRQGGVRTETFSGMAGSSEHKAYLARAYINDGKLNKFGQMFLNKMNPVSGGNVSLEMTVAQQARRTAGVNPDLRTPITEQDVVKSLQQ